MICSTPYLRVETPCIARRTARNKHSEADCYHHANRRVTDPYARWCDRGRWGEGRPLPIRRAIRQLGPPSTQPFPSRHSTLLDPIGWKVEQSRSRAGYATTSYPVEGVTHP